MATIQGRQTIGSIWALNLSGDPSASSGTSAPIGSFGSTTDGTGFWAKTGAGDTAWNKSILNNIGITGGTTLVGGTGVTDAVIYKGTSANATTTVVAHSFVGGNNGATTIASLYNDGQFLVGTTTRILGALGVMRVGLGTATVDFGQVSAGFGGIWLSTATPSITNYAIQSNATTTTLNGVAINLALTGVVKWAFGSAGQISTSFSTSSGVAFSIMTITAQQNNTVTASTEMIDIRYNLSATKQWSTGALALQRDFVVNARTYGAVGASVFTDCASMAISSSPMAGTNMTITNSHGILVQSGAVAPIGAVTNSYGFTCNAQTGATNNYCAQFLGGNVGFITSAPTAYIHMGAGTATARTAPLKFTSGTNNTTAETGAMEYNGTNLFFTRTGTTRETINCSTSGASAPATNAIGVIVDYFGTSATRVLTTPDSWEAVNIGGTAYKRPLYL